MLCLGHSHRSSGGGDRRHLCRYAKVRRILVESWEKKFSYRKIKFLKNNISSCSCPHYRGYTTNSIPIPTILPWLLSPFLQKYRRYCLNYCGNYHSYHGITAVPIPMSLVIIVVDTGKSKGPAKDHYFASGMAFKAYHNVPFSQAKFKNFPEKVSPISTLPLSHNCPPPLVHHVNWPLAVGLVPGSTGRQTSAWTADHLWLCLSI